MGRSARSITATASGRPCAIDWNDNFDVRRLRAIGDAGGQHHHLLAAAR
jgi:hypothetical protein